MKETLCTIARLIGGFIAAIFGGWDSALVTLVIFMSIDFFTGVVTAAMKKSKHNGNRRTIAIECIMSSAYNDKDKKSEDNAAKLAMALLKKYNLSIDHLYTHTHWLNVRDGKSGSVDYLNTARNPYKMYPLYILPHWSAFKAKVQAYMKSGTSVLKNQTTKQLYRVRRSWNDAKSQISAFASLENTKKACKSGYSVFDANGKVVYLAKKSIDAIAREVI